MTLMRQHLIDPEICIRCGACEAACPIDAITHDDRNYVVKPDVCAGCMDCIAGCPTGAIDNWLTVPEGGPHSIEVQFEWDEFPEQPDATAEEVAAEGTLLASGVKAGAADGEAEASAAPAGSEDKPWDAAHYASKVAPWSASRAYRNLYGVKAPTTATVTGNSLLTDTGAASEARHIVLDFGEQPFPVLEGQTIGIIPPGTDAKGRPYVAREYSVASSRSGEYRDHNNLSLTVKRVTEDPDGKPMRGVASNYLCDLEEGATVQVIGPFGVTFLMPNHAQSNIVMICTGTGSAPMRAMTEWRRRQHNSGQLEGGRLILFYGARSRGELPYFDPLQKLPKHLIDISFAFSREPGEPKRYVQDVMRERAEELATMLHDANSYFYICGLKAMEEGVLRTLADVARGAGLDWGTVAFALQHEGRLQLETY